eukprot:Tbor_TRINITY_DN2794_c0_g1::TRINITY_DN2794_c0_g1_i1::g.15216::m.15216
MEMPKNEFHLPLFSPIMALDKVKRTIIGVSLAISFILVIITYNIVAAFPSVFYTGPLGVGQLCGFYCAYMGIILFMASKSQIMGCTDELSEQISALGEFSAYMLLFFFCDRTTIIPRSDKKPDQTVFWGLWAVLIMVALCTIRRAKPPVVEVRKVSETEIEYQHDYKPVDNFNNDFHVQYLQRDQTEEWKGWMQVMFLWYHYFNATEIYNVIRLYIAAYVWMTGFGNFSYYYVRKDFCFGRFFQMQWRINFMATWVCAIMGNEYMLYYICFLHTFFTVLIYAALAFYNQFNTSNNIIFAKVCFLFIFSYVMWDVDRVFQVIWKPFTPLVQYHDPYLPNRDVLSEWQFRSYLDHFIWIVGMLSAFFHPNIDSLLQRIDALSNFKQISIKCAVICVTLIIGYLYVVNIFLLPKKEYNKLHPYTSFIPIILFIILRNISTRARQYHLHLFEFLGKTTLETYIAQFHIWMATTGLNGSPKKLLKIIPGDMPLLNFFLVSAIFFFVSYRLFQTTNILKNFVLPPKVNDDTHKRNIVLLGLFIMCVYLSCSLIVR